MAALLVLPLLLVLVPSSPPCFGLGVLRPVEIVRSFAPVGQYAGHWGLDIVAPEGSDVEALGDGTVAFAGSVAGRLSVTVNHGGSVRTSYSYLAGISVRVGQDVRRGTSLGTSGSHGDLPAWHMSLRLGNRYLDPRSLGRCSVAPQPGLWLSPGIARYPVERDWHPRRHIRPTSHRAPGDSPRSVRPTVTVASSAHAGGGSMAEVRQRRGISS